MATKDIDTRDVKKEIGARIRAYRLGQGLSLRKLGLMIGADHNNLSDIELGRANATVDTLEKIALGLGIDFELLFVDKNLLK